MSLGKMSRSVFLSKGCLIHYITQLVAEEYGEDISASDIQFETSFTTDKNGFQGTIFTGVTIKLPDEDA